MTSVDSIRIEVGRCPLCNSLIIYTSYPKGCYSFSLRYTDGRVTHAETHDLLKCPKKNKLFWRKELVKPCTPASAGVTDEAYSYHITEPSIRSSYYDNLFTQELWDDESQEKYIRIKVWWSYNDKYRIWYTVFRNDNNRRFRVSHKQRKNLLHLMDLLDASDPSDVIMKAEIHRELGQFDECLKLLNFPFEDQYLQVIDTIKTQAQRKDRKVSVIPRAVKKDVGLSEEQKEALSGELETLDINIPNEARRSAEILRDLGRLDECMRLLAKVRI